MPYDPQLVEMDRKYGFDPKGKKGWNALFRRGARAFSGKQGGPETGSDMKLLESISAQQAARPSLRDFIIHHPQPTGVETFSPSIIPWGSLPAEDRMQIEPQLPPGRYPTGVDFDKLPPALQQQLLQNKGVKEWDELRKLRQNP